MPSLGSGEATAVASTTLSPLVTSAAPGRLLGHAAGLKSQLLATSKLYCDFLFHMFLISLVFFAAFFGADGARRASGIQARGARSRRYAGATLGAGVRRLLMHLGYGDQGSSTRTVQSKQGGHLKVPPCLPEMAGRMCGARIGQVARFPAYLRMPSLPITSR